MKEHIQSLNPEQDDFWANFYKVQILVKLLAKAAKELKDSSEDRDLIRESIDSDIHECMERDYKEMNGEDSDE